MRLKSNGLEVGLVLSPYIERRLSPILLKLLLYKLDCMSIST
nr:MAG TPA: hypothetical protein [Crassvirales sp.]DAG93707.1 MAG TPA: hypothetical protein [Crassvirales sp.]